MRVSAIRISASALALAGAATFLLFFAGCRQQGAEDFVANLPDLPPDLAATLDPKTLATKLSTAHPPPEKLPGVVLAPCCASSDTKNLKVNFTYTKCGPLRDFFVAPVGNLVNFEARPGGGGGEKAAAPQNSRVFRRGEVNRKSVLDTIVCVTSPGPWDATLVEDRHCNGYSPYDSLFINALGDVVTFYWNGGPSNHPAAVGLVSCREVGIVRFACNALSGCTCDASPCAPELPCDCGLQGQW